MPDSRPTLPIGQRVSLPGHFDVPVVLEDARALGDDGSGGYECRGRLPDGRLDEAEISASGAQALVSARGGPPATTRPGDAERPRLLDESPPIPLAAGRSPAFAGR